MVECEAPLTVQGFGMLGRVSLDSDVLSICFMETLLSLNADLGHIAYRQPLKDA